MTHRAVAPVLLLCLAVLSLPGCDKASPVAPAGTTLTISASPAKIQSANGTSTITVVARRANGTPINPGTEIRFDTDLGTIDPVATTNSSGVATAILRGDGRIGTAKVRATAGGVADAATVDIEVGTAAKNISLQPTPTTIPATGGKVTLLALVRDSSGRPLANQGVNFTTNLGTLDSRGGIVFTNANGQARDTLNVSAADLSNNATSVSVTAETAGGDGGLVSDSATVQVQSARPIAAFDFDKGSSPQEVVFINRSTGPGTLTFTWDFGDGSSATTDSPRHTYASPGAYTVTLTVRDPNSGQSDVAIARITVPVTAPGSGT